MENNSPTILVVGGVSFDSIVTLDRLPEPVSATVFSKRFRETVGSTGAAKALALHQLGLPTTLHALIGADGYGETIRAHFDRAELPCIFEIDPRGTERHINLMDADGGRISLYVAYATFEPTLDLARLEALVAACDVLVLNIINYCRWLIPVAKRHGKPIWCDIHNYDGQNPYHGDFIEAADALFLSDEDLPDYGPFMEAMIDQGKQLVVCTHGKRGATVRTAAGCVEVPAVLSYPYLDANGAGDNFVAGFLYASLRGHTPEVCAQYGAIAGGLCVASEELVNPALSAAHIEAEYRRLFGA